MRKKQKPNVYVPAVTNELRGIAVGFLIWGFFLLITFSAYGFMLNNERMENNKFINETLLNVTKPCTLETTIHFDHEPIDFVLVSPAGSRYAPDGCDGYVIDMDMKTITMTVHTKDTGTWTIDYNKKSNTSLQYGAEMLDPEELYITRVMLTPEQNLFNFSIAYDSDEYLGIPLKATAQLTSPSLSQTITLFDGAAQINTPNRVTLTDNQIPYADDWILTIQTQEDLSVSNYDDYKEQDDDTSSDIQSDDDPGQALYSPDEAPIEQTRPTPSPIDELEGLNVSTYDGPLELTYMRTHISIQEPDHNTTY